MQKKTSKMRKKSGILMKKFGQKTGKNDKD